MKTEKEIKERILEHGKKKGELMDLYIQAIGKEQDFYASEITRYHFMVMELEWVLKNKPS